MMCTHGRTSRGGHHAGPTVPARWHRALCRLAGGGGVYDGRALGATCSPGCLTGRRPPRMAMPPLRPHRVSPPASLGHPGGRAHATSARRPRGEEPRCPRGGGSSKAVLDAAVAAAPPAAILPLVWGLLVPPAPHPHVQGDRGHAGGKGLPPPSSPLSLCPLRALGPSVASVQSFPNPFFSRHFLI